MGFSQASEWTSQRNRSTSTMTLGTQECDVQADGHAGDSEGRGTSQHSAWMQGSKRHDHREPARSKSRRRRPHRSRLHVGAKSEPHTMPTPRRDSKPSRSATYMVYVDSEPLDERRQCPSIDAQRLRMRPRSRVVGLVCAPSESPIPQNHHEAGAYVEFEARCSCTVRRTEEDDDSHVFH